MPQYIKVSSTGRIEETIMVRGIPEYLVHKDLVGANRVIGEVQSVNQSDVQNSGLESC